ncbi:hypothetical protein VNO77_21671 [Canavalia gladiata]|uniref:Uncharacterized protein n=1 Tax=Canavalia gladiata TaxID=3824 RepID=A0AAN9QMJ5_CANGL
MNEAVEETKATIVKQECLLPLTQTMMMTMEMERGPRYEAYAELRERKLRMKYLRQQEYEEEEAEEEKRSTPPRKQVKASSERKGSSSLVAQSVPDFSAALRKENRKPVVNMLPTVMELTPPSKTKTGCGVLSTSRGSKSANAGDKRRGFGAGVRKSYATIDELKSFSSATANAINGESRGVRNSSRVMAKKNILGYRQL